MRNASKQVETTKNKKSGAKGVDNEPIASDNSSAQSRQQSPGVEPRGKTRPKTDVVR